MISNINTNKMGNTNSEEVHREFYAEEEARVLEQVFYSVDSILDELASTSTHDVAVHLRRSDCFGSKAKLESLASKIYSKAVRDANSCIKYVELAKHLKDVSVCESGQIYNFKDIFIKHSLDKFSRLQSGVGDYGMLYAHEKVEMAQFFGSLYIMDLVTHRKVISWLSSLELQTVARDKLLKTIKDKVLIEYGRPVSDPYISVLRDTMIERGIIQPAVPLAIPLPQLQNLNLPRTVYPSNMNYNVPPSLRSVILEKSRLETLERLRRLQQVPSTSRTPASQNEPFVMVPMPQPLQQPEPVALTIQDEFKHFLSGINFSPPPPFDLKRFRTCSEVDRRNCAIVMIELVIKFPKNVPAYAELTKEILRTSKASDRDKTFAMHLCEICEEEIDKIFKNRTPNLWNRSNKIGIFLCQLYIREGLRNQLMNKWLYHIKSMIPHDVGANKTFITALQIILDKMKSRDARNYIDCVKQLGNLLTRKKIPPQFMQWTIDVLGRNSAVMSAASSVSSLACEASGQAAASPQRETGAIRKSSPPEPAKSSSLTVDFQKFLNDLQAGHKVTFDYRQLESCSEAAVKGCALILLEQAAMHPQSVKLYAALTANAIVSQMNTWGKKKIFLDSFTTYIEFESTKCFKMETPEKSLWERIKNIGAFLGELYNFEVIDAKLINEWSEKVYHAVLMDCVPACEALLLIYKCVGIKMKERDPNIFNFYIDNVESSSGANKIHANYHELMNEVLKMKTHQRTRLVRVKSPAKSNMVGDLQSVLDKISVANHAEILAGIVALNIPGDEENLSKLVHFLLSKTRFRPELVPCAIEILRKLHEASNFKIEEKMIKQSVKFVVKIFFNNLLMTKTDVDSESTQLIFLIHRLHAREALDGEGIVEIIEHLAEAAEKDQNFALQLLLDFIKVNGEEIAKISGDKRVLTHTETTLLKHLNTSPSSKVKREVRAVLAVMFSNHQSPSTSGYSLTLNELSHVNLFKIPARASLFFSNLRFFDIDELPDVVRTLDISTACKMESFAEYFIDVATREKNFKTYARLAQMVDQEIEVQFKASFRETFVDLIQKAFYRLQPLESPRIEYASSLVTLIAELYKIGWIDELKLTKLMDTLSEDNFGSCEQLEMFQSLLQIVSLTLIKNGAGEKVRDYHGIIEARMDSDKQTKSFFVCIDILETLENIAIFSNDAPQKIDEKLLRTILFDMELEYLDETSNKVKSLPIKTLKDLEKFVDLFMKKATSDPDDAVLCAKLAVEIQALSGGAKCSLKEMLIDKCQENLLGNLNDGIQLHQLSQILGLLKFVGELYRVGILSYSFINLCLELISDDKSDDAVDCMCSFMRTVGSVVDAEDTAKLDEYFKTYEDVAQGEDSYRSARYKELVELRQNNWLQGEVASSSGNTEMEQIMSNLKHENIKPVAKKLHNVMSNDVKTKEFLTALWRNIIMNSGGTRMCAELCNEIIIQAEAQETTFSKSLIDFLQLRNAAFTSIRKDEFTPAIKQRLGNVLIFIGSLYRLDVVSDEILQTWIQLKLSKQLSFKSLTALLSIVGPKINESNNVRLKGLLINLEEKTHERASEAWKELKADIVEITEIVSGLQEAARKSEIAAKESLDLDNNVNSSMSLNEI